VAVFLFLFWKLCWVPWRNKAISSNLAVLQSEADCNKENMADKLKDMGAISFLEAAVKISHTSPDIPAEVQMSMKDHIMRRTRIQRQTTEPASSTRSVGCHARRDAEGRAGEVSGAAGGSGTCREAEESTPTYMLGYFPKIDH